MPRNFHYRVEEGILLGIILLNIGDFFGILSGDLELIKLLISWAVLAYLIFQVGLTKVIFNYERVGADILIILSYIFFIFKNLVEYSKEAMNNSDVFTQFYSTIIENSAGIVFYSFITGAMLLIFVSLYLAVSVEIKRPSLLHIIHEDGKPPRDPLNLFFRFIVILVVLSTFFIIVFNLMMEWLAMITDAPLMMFGILFYIFIIIRHHKRFTAEHLLFKIGKFGEVFYVKFINLFKYKKTILLGLSGLLVLHLLTEIEVFLIPYIFGLKEITYLSNLDGLHWPLYALFRSDISLLTNAFDAIPLGIAYLLNLSAMILLLFIPAFIWYRLYSRKGIHIDRLTLSVFFSSMISFLLLRAFTMRPIEKDGIAGVDILTESILSGMPSRLYLYIAAGVVIGIGIAVYLLSRSAVMKERLIASGIILIDIFFTLYIFFFSVSVLKNYSSILHESLLKPTILTPIIVTFIGLFLLITLLFYIGGFVVFILETRKEFRYVK